MTEHRLEHEHTPEAISARLQSTSDHSFLGDFVLGAVDGAITTFAIVAGVAGAGLSAGVALVLGLSNVLADGFSMAVGNYLKARSDRQIVERYRDMERRHIELAPDGEREEVRQIFANKGFSGETLEEIVRVIVADRKRWIDTMLTEEFGLQINQPSAVRAGAVTFFAFVCVGLIPIMPLVMSQQLGPTNTFLASAAATAMTFAIVGAVRGRISQQSIVGSGLETVLVGGIAASLAYVVGNLLKSYVALV